MKVLVLGGGGREHALCWALKRSKLLKDLFCLPGNGGISEIAKISTEIDPQDFSLLADFCLREKIDLVVPGPEDPLVKGITDVLTSRGIRVFGPTKYGAQLEGSKAFAKEILQRTGVPTAEFAIFDEPARARAYVEKKGPPLVIKADGLCAGKGVFVCQTLYEAYQAIEKIMEEKIFGEAGNKIVIEEYLTGEEASYIILTDGEVFRALPTSQDHKRLLDKDEGPNTGGMGAYSPTPLITSQLKETIEERVIKPILGYLKKEGHPYFGFLYAGLMISKGIPYVLEFNCRLGDPEAQAILPRIKNDFLSLLQATLEGRLSEITLEEVEDWAVCVVMASQGYPGPYEKGKLITGLEKVAKMEKVMVFHAGTKKENGKYYTNGGRVLGVTALGETLEKAIQTVYEACEKIHFDKSFYRKDIGVKAFKYIKANQ